MLYRLLALTALILALSLGGIFMEDAVGSQILDISISEAKRLHADPDYVYLANKPITYSANGVVYIEDRTNECCGIRVENAGTQPGPGNKLDVYGYMSTNEHGERYIDATNVSPAEGGSAAPVAMTARRVGGGDWFYTFLGTQGQKGVFEGVGLNNVGLLVRICGQCTKLDDATFTVNDGSATIRCIVDGGDPVCANWEYVAVTGVSSILYYDEQYRPVVRVRSVDVIAPGESVSEPGTPSGQNQPLINVPFTYTTSGATCNLCHAVEYRFDWGDGTTSGWSTEVSAAHGWATLGQKSVKVTARCIVHNIVTASSEKLTVNVNQFLWQSANGPTGSMRCLAFDPNNVLFAGTLGAGIFRTYNEGQSWQQINNGLGNGNILTLMVSPGWGMIYAGTNGSGIYRSSNNGDLWQPANNGLTNGNIYAFAEDSSGNLYAGTLNGVHKSTNGGSNWSRTWPSINPNVYALVVDPYYSIIYAGTYGSGVYRSLDGGVSWTPASSGLQNAYINTLAIDSQSNVYCGTQGGGVFRSTNHGDTWQYLYSGGACPYIQSIALTKDDHIYAATFGYNYGVYRSVDSGVSWLQIMNGLGNGNVYEVKISPSGRIFAATYGSGVYKGVYLVSE